MHKARIVDPNDLSFQKYAYSDIKLNRFRC